MRRDLPLKPPLILLLVAVAAFAAGVFLVGLPGACAGGGVLDNALQNHQHIQETAASVTVFGGAVVAFLAVVWLVAVLAVRAAERLG